MEIPPGKDAFLEAGLESEQVPDVISFDGRVPRVEPVLPHHLLLFPRQSATALVRNNVQIEQRANHHHRFVLICAWRGRGTVWSDDRCFAFEPGHAFLVFPFQKHYYVNITPERINWLFTTFDHPLDPRLELLRSRPPISLTAGAVEAARGLIRAWRGDDEPMGPLYLAQLLHRLRQAAEKRPYRVPRKGTDKGILGKINACAFENRNRAVSTDEVARKLGFSSSHLRALFREQTGQPLGRHLRDFRLQHACSLLRGSNRRIGEIADDCGYDSVFAFSRSFKQAYACSPSKYRARGIN